MIPVHKLYKKFTSSDSYIFAFNAAYDTIQVMVKFTHAVAGDKLTVSALEMDPDSTIDVPVDPIAFVAEGFPIAGNSHEQIHLFDWKAPAMRVDYTKVTGDIEVFVKTFSYGLADATSPSQFTSATEITNGMLAPGKFGYATGSFGDGANIGGNTLNTGREVPAA